MFVQGKEPQRLEDFFDGGQYTINWDIRKTIQESTAIIGFFFKTEESGYWIYSNTPGVVITYFPNYFEIAFQDNDGKLYAVCVTDCCPANCNKPYDNTIFCWDTHTETPFSLQQQDDPGLAKQVFISTNSGIIPIQGVALTRSADAYNEKGQLLYGTQKWAMVWDFELNRLMDVFPAEWLRYGAAFYYQNQTLRKEIKAGCSNRKPYYIEIVDLGLTNTPQGSFNLDKDGLGQRSTNWDVPSRLVAMHRQHQQRAPKSWGMASPTADDSLYTEFNHLSVDAFGKVIDEVPEAQRQRFVSDRNLFLDHTTRQRFQDQLMFLTKEVAERTLRQLTDIAQNGKQLTDVFNPEAANSFGYFTVVILNAISKKMLRSNSDTKLPFDDFTLGEDEETSADWLRYIYGEIRRLVEINKIDKKDFQATMLEALAASDPTKPNDFLTQLQARINPALLKQQYDLAADGRIAPGAGVTDPDTAEENILRGSK